jgi:hypothetical protein
VTEPDLVLHLGLPPACPVDLQRALAHLRPQLRERGVGYLGDADLAAPDGAAEALARARREARGGLVLVCTDSVLGADAPNRADDPVFRPDAPAAVAELVRALGCRRVRLSLHVRRQDRLMEQAYVREVLGGARHPFRERFPYHRRPVLDFGDLVRRLAAVPGVAQTVPRPAEVAAGGRAAFVDDLLGVVGLRGDLDVAALEEWVVGPPCCSPRGLRVALALNRHLQNPAELALARGFVETHFPAGADENGFLSAALRADILDAYGEANRRLFATYLPELPADSYADDAATADLGTLLRPRPDAREPAARLDRRRRRPTRRHPPPD